MICSVFAEGGCGCINNDDKVRHDTPVTPVIESTGTHTGIDSCRSLLKIGVWNPEAYRIGCNGISLYIITSTPISIRLQK